MKQILLNCIISIGLGFLFFAILLFALFIGDVLLKIFGAVA